MTKRYKTRKAPGVDTMIRLINAANKKGAGLTVKRMANESKMRPASVHTYINKFDTTVGGVRRVHMKSGRIRYYFDRKVTSRAQIVPRSTFPAKKVADAKPGHFVLPNRDFDALVKALRTSSPSNELRELIVEIKRLRQALLSSALVRQSEPPKEERMTYPQTIVGEGVDHA